MTLHVHSSGATIETTFSQGWTFGRALEALRDGQYVRRAGWNGKGQWIALQQPDEHSKMTLPYIYICPVGGVALVPWVASQTDILAKDWELASA